LNTRTLVLAAALLASCFRNPGPTFTPSGGFGGGDDRDGDGIADDNDKCPDVPEDYDGFQDEDGCPEPDNDGDGTLDQDDACPNVAGAKSERGCPKSPSSDRDSDGVLDSYDKCPDDPGSPNNGGCP
jgi:hypothetical protein